MSLPQTFKAARFETVGADLKLVDLALVYPAAGEVLMKVLATGICRSDDGVKHAAFGSQLCVPFDIYRRLS